MRLKPFIAKATPSRILGQPWRMPRRVGLQRSRSRYTGRKNSTAAWMKNSGTMVGDRLSRSRRSGGHNERSLTARAHQL